MKRILIMGLPGAGKTTLATELQTRLNSAHFNADKVRALFNDWDFSTEGRIRQSKRMRVLADDSSNEYAIADFVAPLKQMRDIYAAEEEERQHQDAEIEADLADEFNLQGDDDEYGVEDDGAYNQRDTGEGDD